MLLNVIALGLIQRNNMNQMITISNLVQTQVTVIWDLANLGQFDCINQKITISMFTFYINFKTATTFPKAISYLGGRELLCTDVTAHGFHLLLAEISHASKFFKNYCLISNSPGVHLNVRIDSNVNQDKAVEFLKKAALMRKLEIKHSGKVDTA